jgi:hypothetical protein
MKVISMMGPEKQDFLNFLPRETPLKEQDQNS